MNLRENIKKELRLITEQGTPQRMGFLSCKCSDADQYGSCAAWRASSQYGSVSTTWDKQYLVGGQTPYVGQIIAPGAVSTNPGHSGFNIGAGYHVIDVLNPNTPPGPNWDALTGSHSSCNFTAGGPPCDTTTASPCAVQWWQNPNATWASTWITNRDCSNYTWPALNLETQALALMASAPNPQPNVYNDWNDIWSSANAGWPNTTGGPKAQFIGKMAKSKYSQCQKQACNC